MKKHTRTMKFLQNKRSHKANKSKSRVAKLVRLNHNFKYNTSGWNLNNG